MPRFFYSLRGLLSDPVTGRECARFLLLCLLKRRQGELEKTLKTLEGERDRYALPAYWESRFIQEEVPANSPIAPVEGGVSGAEVGVIEDPLVALLSLHTIVLGIQLAQSGVAAAIAAKKRELEQLKDLASLVQHGHFAEAALSLRIGAIRERDEASKMLAAPGTKIATTWNFDNALSELIADTLDPQGTVKP